MAAPVGAVWLADEHRYRTAEEQTEGTMPANLWLIGFSHMVLPARTLPAQRDDWSRPPTLSATVWQAIIRKGATKPRNMPYDKSALSFHNGCAAVVVDMLQPNKPFIVSLADVPASSKAVFGQLKHQQCGETAWMRSAEDVKAVFIDQYEAGELADYTKDMTNSKYSLPWPPIADHLTNLAIDKGAPHSSLAGARWHLEGVHLQRDAG